MNSPQSKEICDKLEEAHRIHNLSYVANEIDYDGLCAILKELLLLVNNPQTEKDIDHCLDVLPKPRSVK